MTDFTNARRKPAHWRAPETILLVRALHALGVRRAVIMRMTGVSDTAITSYVTRIPKHRIRQKIASPGRADILDAAERLVLHYLEDRAPREHVADA